MSLLRPYLEDGAVGGEFRIANFAALVLMCVVVGAWLWSARGMMGGITGFLGGGGGEKSVLGVVRMTDQEGSLTDELITGGGAGLATGTDVRSTGAPGRAPACVVTSEDCSLDVMDQLRRESGCAVECAGGGDLLGGVLDWLMP